MDASVSRPEAGPRRLASLTLRRDFVACSRARKWVAPGLILQGRRRGPGDEASPRIGYTCSKKIGNAVTRNRAKRRLRAAAAEALAPVARPGWDYVLVGRPGATVARGYPDLIGDIRTAVAKLHRPPPKPKAAAEDPRA